MHFRQKSLVDSHALRNYCEKVQNFELTSFTVTNYGLVEPYLYLNTNNLHKPIPRNVSDYEKCKFLLKPMLVYILKNPMCRCKNN